ncbi:MAG: glucose-6-phosphate isomerase [Desulfobulbaceae bacterium]|jgi:glucose-6-phosphate isomerase|nr:glucose-6-phosphate isomerase [Desulfobulbaceae bacterium]
MNNEHCILATAPASVILRELARHPFDLTAEGALRSKRITRHVCDGGPFRLLYATERIDERTLDALQTLADECQVVEMFKAMRRGAVVNKIEGCASENRQALHTACRDIFVDAPAEPKATAQAKIELDKLRCFLTEIEQGAITNAAGEKFTGILHVGIGGSDLGPRSIIEALKAYRLPGRDSRFIANVDPDDAARALAETDLAHTLVCIVSKSGTTLETRANEQLVRERLRAAGLDPKRHCLAITGQGSPMDNPANYLRSFYMYDYIGGRYSGASMVGAVTLGFLIGYDGLIDFLRGAATIDWLAEEPDMKKNLPLTMAMLGVWNHNFLDFPTLAVLPYSQALHRFPAHLQQCDMESNGKSITTTGATVSHQTGPVVWGEPGTNGQHAFYQLLHQGTEIVPTEFIGFIHNQYGQDCLVDGTSSQQKLFANMLAQALALATGKDDANPNRRFSGNRPSCLLIADRLTPYAMGALLAIYETKIVMQGFCWGINSFDQEGVQLGKALASRLLGFLTDINAAPDGVEKELLQQALHPLNEEKTRT